MTGEFSRRDFVRAVAAAGPFYAVGEAAPYRMYHDLDSLPIPVW
jgi:hypothetical protein